MKTLGVVLILINHHMAQLTPEETRQMTSTSVYLCTVVDLGKLVVAYT
jgi:hypothetical protein